MQDAATATGLRRLLLPITLLFFATGVVVPMLRRRRLTATTLVLRPSDSVDGTDSLLIRDQPLVELLAPLPAQAETPDIAVIKSVAESHTPAAPPGPADSLPRKAGRLSLGLALGIPTGALAGVALMGGLLLAVPGWNQGKDVTVAPEATTEAQADLPPAAVYAISSTDVSIAPATDTALLGTILEGDVVHILGRDLTGAWSAISFPPDTEGFGWVKSAALSGPTSAPTANQALTKLASSPGGAEALNALASAGTKGSSASDSDHLALLAIVTALGMTLLPAALSKLSDS
jgi:hypothetical protein